MYNTCEIKNVNKAGQKYPAWFVQTSLIFNSAQCPLQWSDQYIPLSLDSNFKRNHKIVFITWKLNIAVTVIASKIKGVIKK